MRKPAPPYVGEGPHALWHVSDDPAITRFEPRPDTDGRRVVWAIDTRHLPLYWFPRDCPRGTFWAGQTKTPADRENFLGDAARVHAVQSDWVGRMEAAVLAMYQLPETTFAPHPEVGGYWTSTSPVTPLPVVELSDLRLRHAEAGISLRVVDDLWGLWETVIRSSLEFSGMRLRNL